MKHDLIIQVEHGGLGDHLFYSHLPRIAKTTGRYKNVYISNQSKYRQGEYKDLIWVLNPYIDGFVEDEGVTVTDLPPIKNNENLFDSIMRFYGLDDGIVNHEPEIYYRPNEIDYLKHKNIYDPNYISNIGLISQKKLKKYLLREKKIDYQMRPREKYIGVMNEVPLLDSKSIYEYCDIIASCGNFYCLTSGGATLAPAIKKRATVFYGYGQNIIHRHSPLNTYVNLTSTLLVLVKILKKIFKCLMRRKIE
jgi:hypothetical protein